MTFAKRFLVSFFGTSLLLMVLTLIEVWRFGEVSGFIRVSVFSVAIALLVTLSYTLFFMKIKKEWLNLILGVLPLLPILVLLQVLFGRTIFRASLVIFILFVTGLIGYSLSAYWIHQRAKKDTSDLNHLLKGNPSAAKEKIK
jgi:hypothetical protein